MCALDSSLLTGDPTVDMQHEHLFVLVHDLGEAVENGVDWTQFHNMVLSALHYTEGHFADEEALMKRVAYPEYEHQRAEHANFRRLVLPMLSDLLSSRSISPKELHETLAIWLEQHVQHEDGKLAEFLRTREA